jgi:hypothetical protein
MSNALAHAGKTQPRMVSAAIATVFVQDSAEAARAQWRSVADQLRTKFPKLGTLMDEAEIKRRTNVAGIFPNDASITRLLGAMMLEQNDEWSQNPALHAATGAANAQRYCFDSDVGSAALSMRISTVRVDDLHHSAGHYPDDPGSAPMSAPARPSIPRIDTLYR